MAHLDPDVKIGFVTHEGTTSLTVKAAVPGKEDMWVVQPQVPGAGGFKRRGLPATKEMSTDKLIEVWEKNQGDKGIFRMRTVDARPGERSDGKAKQAFVNKTAFIAAFNRARVRAAGMKMVGAHAGGRP